MLRLAAAVVAIGAIGIGFVFALYRPDRPAPKLEPGSSDKQIFVVQIIRPRGGLPLAGMVPPQLLGMDARLGFDSSSSGARLGAVGPTQVQMAADGWEVSLVLTDAGKISSSTQVSFEIVLQGRRLRVRCAAGDRPSGTLEVLSHQATNRVRGAFDIELPDCTRVETNRPLGWPSSPLRLHGSFAHLPLRTRAGEHE